MALGDAAQPVQVLQNLIGNALKFRGDAVPRVHVTVEPAPAEDDAWTVSVSDNGMGIASEYFERIFCCSSACTAGVTPRHRHRPGAVQADRGAPRRAHPGGIGAGQGSVFRFTLRRAPATA